MNLSVGHPDLCLRCGWNPHWDQSPGIIGGQVYHDPAITETRRAIGWDVHESISARKTRSEVL